MRAAFRLASAILCPLLAMAGCQSPAPSPPPADLPHPALDRFDPEVAAQLSQARAEATRLLAESSPLAAQASGRLGSLYLAYQLDDAALRSFQIASRLAPHDPRWIYYMAVIRQDRGENEEASRLLREVLEREPNHLAARIRLANALLESGPVNEAEAAFREILKRAPDVAAAHFGLGRVKAGRGDHRGAVEAFKKTLELQPSATQVHYPLAQSYRKLGELDRAREHLARRGEVAVGFPDPAISSLAGLTAGAPGAAYRGDRAVLEGRLQEALREYASAVSLEPANPLYRRSLALTQYKLGDREAAMASIREAIRLGASANPTNPAQLSMDHYTLGGMLANRGSPQEAADHFRESVALDPTNVEALFQWGRAAGSSGRIEEALGHFEAVLRINPRHLEATRLTATALMDLGRFAEALPHLRRLLELEPGNERNRRLLEVASKRAG